MSILNTPDPLANLPRAERPSYATGMLLDAQDFSDEQTYHRGRLARALAHLAGGGTLAGLAVEHLAPSASQAEEIRVLPGLAVDRLGRLVELPRPACRGLVDWFADVAARDGGDILRTSAYDNLNRFVSPRWRDSGAALPARAVVADVFLRFVQCAAGLSPSFAAGPFDALNAVSPSRIRDAYELQLVARSGLSDVYRGLPVAAGSALLGDPIATASQRRDAAQDAVLGSYLADALSGVGGVGGVDGIGSFSLPPAPEHPPGMDTTAVFIARVLMPVGAGNPPTRIAQAPLVDNHARRFLPSVSLLAQWAGL